MIQCSCLAEIKLEFHGPCLLADTLVIRYNKCCFSMQLLLIAERALLSYRTKITLLAYVQVGALSSRGHCELATAYIHVSKLKHTHKV
jgi:hypothetical protein